MDKLTLSVNGISAYRIILPAAAPDSEKYAARELQSFLSQIGGCELPIITDDQPITACEILLGSNAHGFLQGLPIDPAALGPEEYIIRTAGCCLAIAGGQPRGTLYGVYAFLEDVLGCKWFTSAISRIPQRSRIEFGRLDIREQPAFEYREPYMRDAFDGAWCARNRQNSNKSDLDAARGGRMQWYNFHHSFYQLINEKDYFDEHPEYFSLVDGRRLRERSQLCLTNPDVLRICIGKVKAWIRDNPDCRVFSIGQNDWGNYCQCEDCRAIDEHEGSPAGTMISFVNAVAAAIEPEFPHVLLHTFAYQYTRKAPKYVRPRPNVIVRLCTIECCFAHPLESCSVDRFGSSPETGNLFLRDLQEWSQITDRLYIWDYITNFSHYLQPFPNLRVLEANIRLFRQYGVKGVLEQGNFSFGGQGEMNELRSYILAKLLWNPDYGARRAMIEFLQGCYGGAAAAILEWLDLYHDTAEPYHAHINDSPNAPYFTPDLLRQGNMLFDRAEILADDETILDRVRLARLPLRYVEICRMNPEDPSRALLVEMLANDLRRCGITEIWERKPLDVSIDLLKRNRLDLRKDIPRWDYYM